MRSPERDVKNELRDDRTAPNRRGPATGCARLARASSFPPPMKDVTLRVIGTVENGRTSTDDADWGSLESSIVLRPECAAGATGLAQFSHALVVFFMHVDPLDEAPALVRRPRGREDMPMLGVFAQRGRMRPNPIGVTAVEVVRVEDGAVVVRGLDAIDGTPVLDLKPYVPAFDRRDATSPEWMTRLMQGYFEP